MTTGGARVSELLQQHDKASDPTALLLCINLKFSLCNMSPSTGLKCQAEAACYTANRDTGCSLGSDSRLY